QLHLLFLHQPFFSQRDLFSAGVHRQFLFLHLLNQALTRFLYCTTFSTSNLVNRFGHKMSTNGGSPGGLPNGVNGHITNGTGIYGDEHPVPPSRPSSPECTTPRVLLDERLAEAPSRNELMNAIPTSQPPFFAGIPAYTHAPLPARGSLGSRERASNGTAPVNGLAPTTPIARSSRYLTVPGQNGSIASTLQGLQISSCSDNMLIPTPHNTPAATPRTSPITPGRESSGRVSRTNPVTPSPPSGARRVNPNYTDSPYPGMIYGDQTPVSPPNVESGLLAPTNTPVTPSVSPQRSPTSSDGRVDTPRPPRRYEPALFGSSLNLTRQRGGGPKKKQKGKLTNGKLTNGKAKAKGKGAAKDKMLDDTALAVAHGESPIYSENIVAILQHPEAIAVLSSAPEVDPADITELLATAGFKDVLAAFIETGRAGQNDPDFLEEALAASVRRSTGDFDDVLEDKFEETWAEEGGEEYSEDEEGAEGA
ncbi:hypothetical protein DL98DRAFT_213811, partial [Cadophora sp. DSE1049]